MASDIVSLVCIEYMNLPMKFALQVEGLKQRVEALFIEDVAACHRLQCSSRTFRQYMNLGGAKELAHEISETINQYMSEADVQTPYPLVKAYPYIGDKEWTLEMRDVSHMSVSIRCGDEEYLAVTHIKRKGMLLFFEPYGIVCELESEVMCQRMMKDIILNGRVRM